MVSGVDVLQQNINNNTTRNSVVRNNLDNNQDELYYKPTNHFIPVPDDAGSRTQLSRASGKSGYCYIGEDRGFRSCIKVGEADMCMSGDIFPSQEICINPNLRA